MKLIFWLAGYKTNINQRTEFKKFVVQCVLLCLSYLMEKINKKGKSRNLNFAETNVHRKTNAGGSSGT